LAIVLLFFGLDSNLKKSYTGEVKKGKSKRKLTKHVDGSWDTSDLYRAGKNPFDMEWIKYYNPVEGRDQILFLYLDKETGRICKHRILR
jgi:hypothetical protein